MRKRYSEHAYTQYWETRFFSYMGRFRIKNFLRYNQRMNRLFLSFIMTLLAACAHTPSPVTNPLAEWVPSPNVDARRPGLIVIHATEQRSAQESLDTLRTANRLGRVSAHYLIGDDGRIYQLVDDSARAWHAGGGRWGTITELNSATIGIEMDNEVGEAYTDAQITALLRLLDDLTTRWSIPKTQVIGHSDLAPTRKRDPGSLFPWDRLAASGYGLWPQSALQDPPAGFDPWMAMAVIGYALDDRPAALRAFHRHYRAQDDGDNPDVAFDADDMKLLYALAKQRMGEK